MFVWCGRCVRHVRGVCGCTDTRKHLFLHSTQWSCPTQTDSSSDVYIDYKIGARKSYSPMQGEDKTLTSILRNDKLLSYLVEPFAFAPNANHELCYGFGLSGPASLGPPFKLFANASKAAKTVNGTACDAWEQSAMYQCVENRGEEKRTPTLIIYSCCVRCV